MQDSSGSMSNSTNYGRGTVYVLSCIAKAMPHSKEAGAYGPRAIVQRSVRAHHAQNQLVQLYSAAGGLDREQIPL
ncbi:hypothetical protein GCM10020370_69000 [Paenibacillus hodogayensis]